MCSTFFRLSILLTVIISLNSCKESIESYPDKNLASPNTKIIAHKAGGDESYNQLKENSLDASIYSFANADGIEIDIQKSRNNTLWLYHDEIFTECDGKSQNRLPALTDTEITHDGSCMGYPKGLTRLEEIFSYHRTNQLDKRISLDIKSWVPTKYSEAPFYLSRLADAIIKLTKKYDMASYIMVECENADFLNHIKRSDLGIECYLTTMGDFDNGMSKALKAGYSGLSFKYDINNPPSQDQMNLLRKKGLKIQFWTIDNKADILKALDLKPDYLQTDNYLIK